MKYSKVAWAAVLGILTTSTVFAAPEDATKPQPIVVRPSVEPQELTDKVPKVIMSEQDVIGDSEVLVVRRGVYKPEMVNSNTLPVRIDADKLKYNGTSGDTYANGDVQAVQGNRDLRSPALKGNVNTEVYETEGGFTYLEDGGKSKNLKGDSLVFHAKTNESHGTNVFGYVAPYWVKAEEANFDGQVGLVKKGWVTTEHAIAFKGAPDYRVEGDYIDIIPNDKMVIHNARFYIKNTKILSMKEYTTSLRRDKNKQLSIFSFIPRPYYNSSDGLGLRGRINYPVSERGELFFHYIVATNSGFKPSFGYNHNLPWGRATLGYSRESASLDAKTVWIEKKPELAITTNAYYIGNTPFTVRGGASAGYWKEDYLKGMHYNYYSEISHTPIKPTKSSSIRAYAGYQRDFYGYNNHIRSMPYWGIHGATAVGPRVNIWAGYRQHNISPTSDSPYPFDTIDVRHNLYYGASLQLTRLDRISVSSQKDLQTHETRYVDISWYRDMHSFAGELTYRLKQHKWEYKFIAKDF